MDIVSININIELGKRIAFLRKKRNLSQEELAFRSNVNCKYLSDLERGKRNPTLNILDRISKGLNISLETLFKGIGGPYEFN